MRRPSRLITVLLTFSLFVLAWGCSGCLPAKAPIGFTPTDAEVQATRAMAIRVADATTAGLAIVDEAGKLVAALPVPTATKDAIDCSIIKVTGTTAPPSQTVRDVCQPLVGSLPNGPGPLHAALGKLGSLTARPSLVATAAEILGAIDPLISKLDQSGNASLRMVAVTLRATFVVVRGLLSTAGGAQ